MKRMKVLFGKRRMMVLRHPRHPRARRRGAGRIERELHGHVGQPRQRVHGRGNVHLSNTSDSSATIDAPMMPGDTWSTGGTVDIANTGDADGTLIADLAATSTNAVGSE